MPLVARGAPAHPELPHPLGSPFPPSTVAGRADVIGVAKIGVAHRVRAQLSKASATRIK